MPTQIDDAKFFTEEEKQKIMEPQEIGCYLSYNVEPDFLDRYEDHQNGIPFVARDGERLPIKLFDGNMSGADLRKAVIFDDTLGSTDGWVNTDFRGATVKKRPCYDEYYEHQSKWVTHQHYIPEYEGDEAREIIKDHMDYRDIKAKLGVSLNNKIKIFFGLALAGLFAKEAVGAEPADERSKDYYVSTMQSEASFDGDVAEDILNKHGLELPPEL